jgi:carboxyl-terminal processing protease
MHHRTPKRRAGAAFAAVLGAVLLAACGGGDDGVTSAPASCTVADQNDFLSRYFDDWYFWYALSPHPNPAAYTSVAGYFDALLYTGGDASFPADRWSYSEPTVSFNRFYGDGESEGYGFSVNGLEVSGMPTQPLYVRHVEPQSDAAAQGIQRGDRVLRMNGVDVAELIARDDFSLLTPPNPNASLLLRLSRNGVERDLTVTSRVYRLTPIRDAAVLMTPFGRKLGYVVVKDMISQALAPLDTAFASFRAQGVTELVLDLRYNGGGLVSVAGALASYAGGAGAAGQAFASLLYNDKRAAAYNQTFRFANPAPAAALGLTRVYVLTGRRTCSASEQVINGLRGTGIDVVAIGETTCGKPVGFLPQDDGCGTTYSVVNFESVNARYEGRYFDGFDATCPVAENWSKPLGANDEPLLAAAQLHADTGACPVVAARETPLARRSLLRSKPEPGERSGMWAR